MSPPRVFSCETVAKEAGVGVEAAENWLLTTAGPADIIRPGRGQPALFTDIGRKKFAVAAGADSTQRGGAAPAALAVAGLNGAGGGHGPRREDLRITRANLSNRAVLAERANGLEVQVMVRSTALLKPGMVLPDCVEEGALGWNYLGRLPRMLGEQQLFYPKAAS